MCHMFYISLFMHEMLALLELDFLLALLTHHKRACVHNQMSVYICHSYGFEQVTCGLQKQEKNEYFGRGGRPVTANY